MPKITFVIDNSQLKRIREEITQSVFGSDIYTIGDCRLLAEDIELRSGMRLGINTIRRFFGLLEAVPPSKNTLDILALYCGYKNWSAFISVKVLQSIDVVVGDLIMDSLINGNVCWKDYLLFRKKFKQDKNIGDAIFKIILVALQFKDYEFLIKAFDDKIPEYISPATDINPFFYSLALGSFIRANPSLHHKILPVWATQKEGQRLFFEFYVDIDNLCGYYGDYIIVYRKHKTTPEACMFVATLEALKAFFLNDRKAMLYYNEVLASTKDYLSIHPYPVFRKYASFIRFNGIDSNKNKHYVQYLIEEYIDKISIDKVDDLYLSGYVILLALNEVGLYKDVLEMYKRFDNQLKSDWFLIQLPVEQYKINLTMAYVGLQEYKKAMKIFTSIKTEYLFSRSLQVGWDKIIYLLTKARLQKEAVLFGNYTHTLVEAKVVIEMYRCLAYERYCLDIDLWLMPNNN